jgi:hypothetical protein
VEQIVRVEKTGADMKAIVLTAIGVCLAGFGFAASPQPEIPKIIGSCLIMSGKCLDVSKIVPKACRVAAKNAAAPDACAVDGMKLVGKLTDPVSYSL